MHSADSTPKANPPQTACDLCGAWDAEFLFASSDGNYVQCRTCQLIYGTASAAELSSDYDEQYDPSAEYGVRCQRVRKSRWRRKAQRRLARFEHYRRTGRILEIGCGYGDTLEVVQQAGWRATGVEISDVAAGIARERRGLDVRSGIVEELRAELPACSFDVVFAANLLEHLVSPRLFLQEIERLLRPGGVFVGSTLNAASWGFRLSGAQWEYAMSARHHRYVFTPSTLRQYCDQAELHLKRCTTTGFRFVSKLDSPGFYSPLVRFVEQGVAAVAQVVGQGHRIEIWAQKPAASAQPAAPLTTRRAA